MNTLVAALLLGAFLALSAVVGGHNWHVIALSYALFWPMVFAFAVLPGVLIGRYMETWQSSVAAAEIMTTVGTIMVAHPTLEQLFQPSFGMLLAMAHLAVFPPLLLSVLIGHYSRSGGQKPT